jgi:PAS domain S-box-containing protein
VAFPYPPLAWFIYFGYAILAVAFALNAISRHFLENGHPSTLAMGCGVLSATIGITLVPVGENFGNGLGYTIHAISFLISALFHLIGSFALCRCNYVFKRRKLMLIGMYLLTLILITIILYMYIIGILSTIFIECCGNTVARNIILSVSCFLFFAISIFLFKTSVRLKSNFLYFYSLGLCFIFVALICSLLFTIKNSPMQWVTRFSHLFSIIYIFIATISSNFNKDSLLDFVYFSDNFLKIKFIDYFIVNKISFSRLIHCVIALCAVVVAVLVEGWLGSIVGESFSVYMIFVLVIIVVSLLFGFFQGMIVTFFSSIAISYIFIGPYEKFGIELSSNRLELILFFIIGICISIISGFYRTAKNKISAYERDAALGESKSRLEVFAKATFEGIVESENGIIIDCNEQYAVIIGYSVQELIGKRIVDLVDPNDREMVEKNLVKNQESITEHAAIRKDGSRIVIETHGRPVSPGKSKRHTAVRDITDRKRYELELLKAKDEWERTFESVPDLIAILDKEQRIVRTNKAMADRIGALPGECVGLSCFDCVHSAGTKPTCCPHDLSMNDGGMHTLEVRESRLGGDFLVTTTPIRGVDGEIVGSVHVARDITEQKRSEELLKRLNRTLEALTHSSEAMIRATSEEEYLKNVCRIIVEDCGHAMVWIGYAEDDPEKTVRPVASAGFEDGYLETLKINWADNERGRGPTGSAIRTGQVCTCRYMHSEPSFLPWREEAIKRGYSSSIVFPLKSDDHCFGAVTIYGNQPDSFTENEVTLLTELADNLAYGIVSLRLQLEQKRAEEAIRESRALLDLTQRLAKIGGWKYDVESRSITWTDELYRIYGMDPSSSDSQTFGEIWDLIVPGDRERIKSAFKNLIKNGVPYDLELGLISADGRKVWVRTMGQSEFHDGKLARCVGNVIDISEIHEAKSIIEENNQELEKRVANRTSELKIINDELNIEISNRIKAEYDLKESEFKFRSFYNSNPEGIVLIDFDGCIIDSNREFLNKSSYSLYEIVGRKLADYILKPDLDIVNKAILSVGNGVSQGKDIEVSYIAKNNEIMPVSVKGWIVTDDKSIPIYMGIFIKDLTKEKELALEKKLLENQVIQSQKNEAIGTLAGGIAHDFNNILGGIIGFAQLALYNKDSSVNYKAKGYVEKIIDAGNRAKDLIQQILKFSRKNNISEIVPMNLIPVVIESTRLLRSTLPASIVVIEQIEVDNDKIMGDSSQIHQVVMNLCTNAYHAMRDTGGKMTISLCEVTLKAPKDYMSMHLPPGRYLNLSISDTGIGMSRSIMQRIFEPYFTTKKVDEGTGLGMAVTLGIVKSHNGLIEVESSEGVGTKFDIYFPFTSDEIGDKIDKENIMPHGKGENILIVDDKEFFLEIFKDGLDGIGYKATTCNSSLKALEIFKNNKEKYNLVITDQSMPDMTGVQFIEEIMKINAGIPIILCTGFSDIVTEESAAYYGITKFLMKPVNVPDLAQAVHEILRDK